MTPFDPKHPAAGPADAFPDTLLRQQSSLRALAAAIVGDALADDVVQDTWLAALSRKGRPLDRLPAWLHTVARNLAWKRRIGGDRRRARERTASREEALSSPEELIARIEEGHLVERVLTRLDEPYRSTLLWRFYENLSIAEISRRSGLPESTTRTHLQRGLSKLRERLETERGPKWRAALMPLLSRQGAAHVAGAAAGLSGIGVIALSIVKPLAVAVAIAAAVFLLDWSSSHPLAQPLPREATEIAAVDLASPEPLSPTAEVEQTAARAAITEEPRPAGTNAPAKSVASVAARRLLVKDPHSDLGIPHAEIEVNRNGVSETLRTDADGWVELPSALFPAPHKKSWWPFAVTTVQTSRTPTFFAELIVPSSEGVRPIRGPVDVIERDTEFRFRPREVSVFRVELPARVDTSIVAHLHVKATVLHSSGRTQSDFATYSPIHHDGRTLTIALPSLLGDTVAQTALDGIRVLLFTADGTHNLKVDLPVDANLRDGPYVASTTPLVMKELRVIESITRAPIDGVFVSIRKTGEPNSKPIEWANGMTDADGRIRLSGLPTGTQLLIMNKQGHDFTMREVEIVVGPGLLEVELREVPGRSDLRVTVEGPAGGALPDFAAVVALLLPLKNVECQELVHPTEQRSGGWSETTTLVSLPPGRYELRIDTNVPGLAPPEPFMVDVPSPPVVIRLSTPPPSRPLVLRLPDEVGPADVWLGPHDGLGPRLVAQVCSDGARVKLVAERDDARLWVVACEGYVPAFGGREAWTSAEADWHDGPVFELRPRLVRGWGLLVLVHGPGGPVENASVSDPATGARLGRTDERGLVLVRSSDALQRIEVSLGEVRSKTLDVGEAPHMTVFLPLPRRSK